MPLLPDVTMLLGDRDLGAQTFTILRRTGRWERGSFVVDDSQTLTAVGIIQPASPEDLQLFPEGERRRGTLAIYTQTILHITEDPAISDEITWQGESYKVVRVDRWQEYGYCVAYAQKR